MRIAAIYARVSGDQQQRDSNTIASQTEALIAYANKHDYRVAEIIADQIAAFPSTRSRASTIWHARGAASPRPLPRGITP
ncbi:MAG: recombinase family protein [Candidatus Dadabacteria bacterium]|nr:recombinase family protein [Candidatus Dadabacteria bacterium]